MPIEAIVLIDKIFKLVDELKNLIENTPLSIEIKK